jgi:hypothetical protein
MKIKIIFLLVSFSWFNAYSQECSISRDSMLGIWELSSSNSTKIQLWEFKRNGEFNELDKRHHKNKFYVKRNGTWELNKDTLSIVLTNGISNSKRINYLDPRFYVFIIIRKNNMFYLTEFNHTKLSADKYQLILNPFSPSQRHRLRGSEGKLDTKKLCD